MKLYNTLTRKKETFKPLKDNEVSIYACGPTVYDFIHVGNARPVVVFDTLRRFFEYEGYDVNFVVNFTDIDDKVIKKAIDEDLTIKDISERYIDAYLEDTHGLNVKEETTHHPRATEFIDEIIEFVSDLIKKDAAYESNGDVYFRINKAEDYGKLSKKNIDELMAGARIDVNESKENPLDFTLWKKAKEGEPSWPSPWGNGRPGWHIECSVMSRELLGDTIDIHAGGEDLQFPHHENEIAQSETLTGKTFANFWMHNGMLTINDKKMSKSLGNFFTVKDIAEHYDLEVLRFFLLSSHYRTPINFSREIMEQMKQGLERMYNGKNNLLYLLDHVEEKDLTEEDKDSLDSIDGFKENFINSMRDDLNTADGVASVFDLIRFTNQNLTTDSNKVVVKKAYDMLLELTGVLGLLYREDEMLDDEIQALIDKRTKAREDKDYELADQIRDELLNEGIIIEDTSEGIKWKRK